MNAATSATMIERAGRALIDAAPAPAKVILRRANGDLQVALNEGEAARFLVALDTVDDDTIARLRELRERM